MAVIKKTLFPKNLEKFAVLVNDTQSDSKYFKITELSDTFTGGKNAFLIAGSEYLVPDTKIQIELKDSAGNVIYHEPGEGMLSSSVDGTGFITEYYEGVSKVVAVYVYPDTAYGPCTLTILGELNEYQDANGVTFPVPLDWENKYNVKWQKQIDVNPSLANTTKIRFYKRPLVTITELLQPIYRIDNGSKVNSGVSQSFADIKISNLETFAGDVKRVKVFRTSLGDISDFSLIQDILVESKELLTTFGLSGSVIGNTGTFTSETLKNFWKTGSLNVTLSNDRVESGIKLNGSSNFTYSASLDLKSANTYELNLDAFYSSSTSSNLGIYLSQVTTSIQDGIEVPITISSSITTLIGTQPTKNLLDTVIPFKLDRNYPSASLYFSQSQGEWHLGNISLRLSQDTAFSPDEVSFITTMPTAIGNEDFNFKFEFYDVNNNYVPVFVTQSANFTGGNLNRIAKALTFDSDRNAFRFSTGSIGNPKFQQIAFTVGRTNLTGSVTYGRSVYDLTGSYIDPSIYTGVGAVYPGEPTNPSENGFIAHIDEFTGSLANITIGSITYTASCEQLHQHETIYRFEDGDNAPGVFVTADTNQFIYKATNLSLNPSGQVITIEAKRKNLASADTPLTVNSGSGTPPLTYVSTNTINGVDTYTLSGTSYPYDTGETTYFISGSDQFGNEFSDAVKITPVKILDGFSVSVSNENTSFAANSVGSVLGGFAASSGSITVKVGSEVINYSPTFITNSFSASIYTTSGLTTNTFNGTDYSINDLSQDSGSLGLLVKYKDGGGTIISSSKDITYSKVKKAAPVLTFVIGNNNQSTDAKSTGVQLTTFSNSTLSVKEQYNGVNTNLTLLSAPTINSSSTFTPITKTTTNLLYPTMSSNVDSVELSVTGSVVDTEGVTREVFGNVSLTKVKKAQPTITFVITPSAQTVAANSAGTLTGTIIDPTLSAFEGSTSLTYNQGTLTTSQYKITNVTGVTVNNPTPNTSTIDVTGIAANDNTGVVTIEFVDSEGTSGTSTIRFTISKALGGTQGNTGLDGRRTSTGMVFYQLTAASAPTTPTATSYTFSSNSFGGLTSQWGIGAPTYTAGNSNKYWYSTYTAIETTAGGGTAVPTFSAPAQAINFTGLVTFTSTNNITDGVNTSNIVESGSVTNHIGGANVTTIEGGKISTGVITSTGYTLGGSDTLASGSFTTAGTIFNLNNGSLRSKNFYVASNGDAVFKGTLSAAGGTFAGNLSAAAGTFAGALQGGTISIGTDDSIFKADTNGIYLGNATFASAPFRVSPSGALTATNASISGNITATSLTLSAGVTISNTQVSGLGTLATANGVTTAQVSGLGAFATLDKILPNNVTTYIDGQSITTNQIAANSIVAGNIASLTFSGKNAVFDTGSIAGWNMDTTGLYKTVGAYTLRLASNAQRIAITQATGTDTLDRVRIDASSNITAITVSDTASLNWSNSGQNMDTVYGTDSPSIVEVDTGFTLPNGCSYSYGTSCGVIGLQYAEEEIFIEAEAFPSISNTIYGGAALPAYGETHTVYGYWNCTLRVRQYPTQTDAENQTNQNMTYGTKTALVAYREYRQSYTVAGTVIDNIDNEQVYGATISAQGGGGINTPGVAVWYRVEIQQFWYLQVDGGSFDSVLYANKPASDIFVKYGRVQNGYSVFSPGGLQVYQGVRNYLNASVPEGTTGDASNFFIVKGKSQIIGALSILGGLSASHKNFKIQHPLNENKWLYHTSTESPRADLIYRGTIQLQNGEGNVSIDSASNMTIGTFDALTKNPQLFLQNNETFDRVKGYVESGSVYVNSENSDSNVKIDWTVIAERNDTGILQSPLYDTNGNYKTENYKGEYLDATRSERIPKLNEI
jgi:hypothetical protein